MKRFIRLLALGMALVFGFATWPAHSSNAAALGLCLEAGRWVAPGAGTAHPREASALLVALARGPVVLLGESHANAEHHRWQLHTIAALHALQPHMVLGFEMFPRRVQSVLAQWIAGELTEEQFLTRVEWGRVWGFDAQLYLPLFHFARMHRVPMIALNVERSLVSKVGSSGWASIAPSEREGVSDPALPSARYREILYDAYLEHLPQDAPARARAEPDYGDPDFLRFVESMQVWDRAMAQAIAERRAGSNPPLVVGIMGSGHLEHGFGVPHQLRDLGITDAAVLLPWETPGDCSTLSAGLADALFGVAAVSVRAEDRPRLGVMLDDSGGGVVVREVVKNSVAEQAGVRAGDVVTIIAGLPVKGTRDVIDAVQRQAPGTWLPITVRRGSQSLELVARFPPKR